jgi:hypothetical protein
MKPCEQFGPERAREIQELIEAATGIPHEEVCDQCPIAALTERRPVLRIVS